MVKILWTKSVCGIDLSLLIINYKGLFIHSGNIDRKSLGNPDPTLKVPKPTISRESFWNHSIKKWSDITSPFILNDNIICFIALLDVFSTNNSYSTPPFMNFSKILPFFYCFPEDLMNMIVNNQLCLTLTPYMVRWPEWCDSGGSRIVMFTRIILTHKDAIEY